MFSRLPTLLILLLTVVAMAFGRTAQFPSPADAGNDPQRQLERSYELVAKQAMLRYYADNTFLVRAKVELFEEEDGFVDNQTAHPLPALPGLPVQPQGARGRVNTVMDRLASVSYDILVDTSYTIRDRDFIVYLVGLAATLDSARGDLVAVERVVFPRSDKSMASPRKFDNFTPLGGVPGATLVPSVPETASRANLPTISGESRKDPMERIYDLLPLLIVCIFVLLCVWLLARAIASPTALKEKVPFLKGRKGRKGEELDEDEEAPALRAPTTTSLSVSTTTAMQAPPTTEEQAASDAQSIRPYLLNSFVGEPRICGLILKSWLKRDSVKGWRDVGTLVSGLHPRLLQMVQDTLGKENARALEIQLASREENNPEEFLAVAREFRREFQTASSSVGSGDGRDADLFGFLEQLNEGQIMHILRDESMGIVGFALAQLSSEKAGSILQKLDAANRARLLVSMGNITQIPHDVYKEIADRLSLKALEVSNMKFVSADGVESIVALIDNLPVGQQFEYIHSISEVDLNLARKIRERTITLPELSGLPEAWLADKLGALDGDTLALAFLKLEQGLRTKLLGVLPERMQMMVRSGMESRTQATAIEVENAQKKLLQGIRDEIRKNGRPS